MVQISVRRNRLRRIVEGCLWFGATLQAVTAPVPAPTRPNVLFILADDLGWRDLGCYGSTFHETPNLDRLAARGVRFTQAYAANPLCSPTRASILTGLWPSRIGITAPVCHLPKELTDKRQLSTNVAPSTGLSLTRLTTNYVSLARVFRSAGYRTAHFGKWHLGPEPYSPLQHGFESDWPHWPGPGPAGSYVAPWKFPSALGIHSKPGEHIEDRTAEETIRFLRAHRNEPFFVNYWAFSVHSPYDAKDELVARYRARVDPANPQRNPVYAAMVHSLDEAVGRVLGALEELGLQDRTIIVFFSDNGGVSWPGLRHDRPHRSERFPNDMSAPPTSNLPLRNGKASLYEGGIRVPCIVVWPGVTRPGTVCDEVIQSVDFFPTLLEMTGISAPPGVRFDGISFVPALRGQALSREAIFFHFPHDIPASGQLPAAAVRCGNWKLHRMFGAGPDGEDRFELYNLASDLGEQHDQAAAEPSLVRQLNALLEQFLKESESLVPALTPNRWNAFHDCELHTESGALRVESTGRDPQLRVVFRPALPAGAYVLELDLKTTAPGGVELFWQEQGVEPAYHRDRKRTAPVPSDGARHVIQVPFHSQGPVSSLRLDPAQGAGTVWIYSLRLFNSNERIVRNWIPPKESLP